jgi:hypothetical protein
MPELEADLSIGGTMSNPRFKWGDLVGQALGDKLKDRLKDEGDDVLNDLLDRFGG